MEQSTNSITLFPNFGQVGVNSPHGGFDFVKALNLEHTPFCLWSCLLAMLHSPKSTYCTPGISKVICGPSLIVLPTLPSVVFFLALVFNKACFAPKSFFVFTNYQTELYIH